MHVQELKLYETFSGSVQFRVPLYQRQYDWERQQWEKLWEDICSTAADAAKHHFFGVIVRQRIETRINFSQFTLIDGQQRLTTMLLFLAALRDKAFRRKHHDLAQSIHSRCLVNSGEKEDLLLRLVPSATGSDQHYFQQIILSIGKMPAAVKSSRIMEAYHFFTVKLRQVTKAELRHLLQSATVRFNVVVMTLNADEDPHKVFEILNTRGKSLSSMDLIRNFLLMKLADDPQQQRRIYAGFGIPMEEQLGESHLSRFAQSFLMHEKEVFFRPCDIYEAMRDHVEFCEQNGGSAADYIKRMHRFSGFYCRITGLQAAEEVHLNYRFRRLHHLGYNAPHPLLLAIYDLYNQRCATVEDFVTIVKMVENFLVRRTFCRVSVNRLSFTFPKFGGEIRRRFAAAPKEGLVDAVRQVLSQKEYPHDKDFFSAILRYPLYKQSGNNLFCQFVLQTLNHHAAKCRTTDSEHDGHHDLYELLPRRGTIEHIMPSTLSAVWKAELGEHWGIIHKRYLHTIGNLTLTACNSELSNIPFQSKQQQLLADRSLSLNHYFETIASWTESEIMRRATLLAKQAIEIWPYFGPDSANQSISESELE